MELPKNQGKNEEGDDVFVTDQMVDELLNEQNFGNSQRAADNKRNQLSKEEFHKLRVLCKRNLFFLSYSILGNKRLSTNLHGNLCTHIKNTEYERFHSYLLPRGHFKSTIITIAHTIQIILPYTQEDASYDDDKNPLPWPMSLGTDCRVLIGHETAESAARFLYSITQNFTSNPLLMTLFPDAIPSKRKNRINKWELELPRSDKARGNPEPTVDTLGVGAKSQGRHYNYIKLDDIFGDKARDSAAEAEATLQWFDNIQSFFSTFSLDHLDLIGTRYSTDDVYAHASGVYNKDKVQLIEYIRKVEENYHDKENNRIVKRPIFPEEFSSEKLNIIRQNKKVFSAQYENDPFDGESGFDPAWRKYFFWTDVNKIVAKVDKRETQIINVRDLDVCFLIDPGVDQSGGFVVTGVDYVGNIYTLTAIRLDLNAPDLTDLVFKNVARWQPRTVAIESDIFANTFQYWWMEVMTSRNLRFHVTPVYTNKRAKNLRIAGLTPYAEAGKLYINELQTDLESEWSRWGRSKDIHILDALAYGPEVWRPGYAPGQRDMIESQIIGEAESDADPETGYSYIHLEETG